MMGSKSRHHIISGLLYLCYRQSVNNFAIQGKQDCLL